MQRWRVGVLFTCPGYRLMEVLRGYRGCGQVESTPPPPVHIRPLTGLIHTRLGPCPLRCCASPIMTGCPHATPRRSYHCSRHRTRHPHPCTPRPHLPCLPHLSACHRCSSCSPFGCGQHALSWETVAQRGEPGAVAFEPCAQPHNNSASCLHVRAALSGGGSLSVSKAGLCRRNPKGRCGGAVI